MIKQICLIVLCVLLISVGIVGAHGETLKVVATTTIIADVARNVGGDFVTVEALIPPDADVHAFELTPADIVKVTQADMVLVNGAGLEDFLGTLLDNAAEVVVVSNGITMLSFAGDAHHEEDENDEEHAHAALIVGVLGASGVCDEAHEHEDEAHAHEHGVCDPHVWTDPKNVMVWASNIAEAFAAADVEHADGYRANAAAYIAQLEALDAEIVEILSVIPEDARILVTNHEFLGYFAHAYGFEVVGMVISGGTTLAEPSPQALATLVNVIQNEGVKAIFAEISSNPLLAQTIAAETGINVVTVLYSDSLSAADGPAAAYLDYLRYNAQVIAQALSS